MLAALGVMCKCGLLVRKYISRKPPTDGHRFISCPKKIDDQCGFFEWIDDLYFCLACAVTIRVLRQSLRERDATIEALESRVVDLVVSERLLQATHEERGMKVLELEKEVAAIVSRVTASEDKANELRHRLKYAKLYCSAFFYLFFAMCLRHLLYFGDSFQLQLG